MKPLKIKLKAKNRFSNNQVKVSPVFFDYYVGIQWSRQEGELSGSIFCCKKKDLAFDGLERVKVVAIEIYYWLKVGVIDRNRRRFKHWRRVRRMERNDDGLPF